MSTDVSAPSPAVELELAAAVSECYADPLRFVHLMYPWGRPGFLEHHAGPDLWQTAFLQEIGRQVTARKFNGTKPVRPIRMAISSGHGIGKSVMVSWLVAWILATRPNSQGVITANTSTQLETKTWAAIQRWMKVCLVGHWFEANTARLYRLGSKESWFCSPQTCREENSEAFAGQHAADSTSFYIFDEASAVPDPIYEVAEGGLTDGEPMIFLFGNPTRSSGQFHRACFGAQREKWTQTIVDSRTSRFTNQEEIAEWAEVYGEDSDFFRVRVRGLAPNASEAQFIETDRVRDAQKREVVVLPDEPLVAGCDLAWGGHDWNVIRFRRGRDGRSVPAIRIAGELTRDPSVLTNRLADVLSRTFNGQKVHTLFLDSAGIAGAIGSRLRQLGHMNVIEVNFGADAPDQKRRFMRDHIWAELKDWLLVGAIDSFPKLEMDLVGPCLRPDLKQRIWLESKEDMKKRGLDSPDEGDALALTFAAPIMAKPVYAVSRPPVQGAGGWMAG